ncbi:uncharacterized protein LOC103717706 isoform X4 [Phoenix dactylifera]|uniref:Uncharacterized protein LOC103717706 isoform X4 n=1 Tax=Phoenix dactylifera TaxID=42345 RepID=A0A8B7CQR7_PHODC|nr:uncharacterized protein LOC103717706 isoform X4 [Phoenix dactylifera]
MASPSSASRTPPSPPSAAAAEQSPQTAQLQDVAPPVEAHDSKEGIKMLIPKEEPYESKPDLLDPFLLDEDYLKALDEKHIRYDAEYSQRLMAKYFSGKAFNGGNVYDQETIIENETIKSSRYPFTSPFADPVRYYEEQNQSASPGEETSSAPGKKHPFKKSS